MSMKDVTKKLENILELQMQMNDELKKLAKGQQAILSELDNAHVERANIRAGLNSTYDNIDKLHGKIQAVHDDTARIRAELHDTHLDTGKLRAELHNTHNEMNEHSNIIKNYTASIRTEVHNNHEDTCKVRAEVHDVHGDTRRIRDDIQGYRGQIKNVEHKLYKYMDESRYPEALCEWYYERMGEKLDLQNPKTFNEIIQWTKLYDIDDLKVQLADKYKVRDWVADKIGDKYLVPLLGMWKMPDEIDYSQLPDKFVLKCNHGCAYNIIVTDKNSLDIEDTNRRLSKWLQEDYAFENGFELQYSKIERRIIAEEYMENGNEDLYDYKVFCFNGKAKYVMFLSDRHNGLKMQFYDLNWNLQPFVYSYERNDVPIPRPDNLDELIECAEKLAEGFIQVRVDFYRLNDGSLKFGEMTFTSSTGTSKWEPQEYDRILGDMIHIPEEALKRARNMSR